MTCGPGPGHDPDGVRVAVPAVAGLLVEPCDLLTHRVGLANQLRAHLRFFHPGPVGLFADLDAVTGLRFLGRFTCQDDADWLTPSRLATWLRSVGYTGRKDPAALHAHLVAAAPGATGPAGAALARTVSRQP
jgi:transposase